MQEIRQKAEAFRNRLDEVRQANPPAGFTWYGYDIMGNIGALNGLLTGDNRQLLERLGTGPVADIGAADGDLGFFLESLGVEVDIIDYPPTNWNGLQAARRLKELLDSRVAIHEVDLDSQFRLPRDNYSLVFLLGILYHLKNPFYALERLARVSHQLLLSTRITRYSRAEGVDISGLPLAYLVAADECNNDATNYWMFSETGLRQIVERAGWEVSDYVSYGDLEQSNPQDNEHDQRAFMLLSSRVV